MIDDEVAEGLAPDEEKYVHTVANSSREYDRDYPADPETMSFELAMRLAEKA